MLEIIRSKWTAKVLFELNGRTLRFSELKSSIDGISQKMLALVLRQLEGDGLLVRKAYAVIPPRVEYSLTERGSRATEAFRQLELGSIWGEASHTLVHRSEPSGPMHQTSQTPSDPTELRAPSIM